MWDRAVGRGGEERMQLPLGEEVGYNTKYDCFRMNMRFGILHHLINRNKMEKEWG